MNRPYVICHMLTSLDGKVTGDFLFQPEQKKATELYYHLNRHYHADAYACGRVTMQESFCGDYYPDLTAYAPLSGAKTDFMVEELSGFYAVAFDPHGKLGWKSSRIVDQDGDVGYDRAQIIEILTEEVDERYLSYLQVMGIPYLFAGKTEVDVTIALQKLKDRFGIQTLLLEGGSVLDGAFLAEDCVDEISMVVCPTVATTQGKPLFGTGSLIRFQLTEVKRYEGSILHLHYKK